jgi:PhnB protein
MPQPIPYLSYPGTCEQAMRHYERALGAKLEKLMTNGASPMAEHFPKETHHQILHALLVLPGGGTLMDGDCPQGMEYAGVKGVSLALNYDTEAEAKRAFDALAAGGTVTMPLQPSFWAKTWGMCVDRFGVSWIVNGAMLPY